MSVVGLNLGLLSDFDHHKGVEVATVWSGKTFNWALSIVRIDQKQ